MNTYGSILLADDEEAMVRILGPALREHGHEVVETTSARPARQLLGQRPFDVLVVDNLMPEMTGLDLIKDLVKTVPEGDRPQILLMMGQPSIDGAIEAVKSGALDYLQKPFGVAPPGLRSAIRQRLRRRAPCHLCGFRLPRRRAGL